MIRGILLLILISILLTTQLLFGLTADEHSIENRPSVASNNPTAQYLLGVIEYNEGNLELAKLWFQKAYESLEAEEGNVGGGLVPALKTQRFRLALDKSIAPAKVRFPKGYKVNVYYRDGWYTRPKNSSKVKKQIYSFLPGSTYKIRVEGENEQPANNEINLKMKIIAAFVMMTWLISR